MNRSKRLARKGMAEITRQHQVARRQEKASKEVHQDKIFAEINNRPVPSFPTTGNEALDSALLKKGKRLVEGSLSYSLQVLANNSSQWVRQPKDWEPKGKSWESQYDSLAAHLFAPYQTPAFLWSVLHTKRTEDLVPIVLYVAKGGSLYDKVQDETLSVPFTRKMCHQFLAETTKQYSFIEGIRRVQVKTLGGDLRLFKAWMAFPQASTLGPFQRQSETFWQSVLAFFAKNPMLETSRIGPIMDYIAYRHRADATFSMKGRAASALLREVDAWHGELAKVRVVGDTPYKPSGFKELVYETKHKNGNGVPYSCVWLMSEVLSSKKLHAEGKALSHCVYSYAPSIVDGATSIWSLTMDDNKVVTIEVRNHSRTIVQCRGKYNRRPTHQEYLVIQKWGQDNGLHIGQYSF